MKRILAFSILMVFMFSVAAMATETRVETMGYVNEVVKDDANIWLYPSTLAMYPNMMIGEFYDGDFEYMGGHWATGDYTFAAYFSDDADYYIGAVGENIDHRIDLFWAMNFADMPWGLRISFWKDGYKYERSPMSVNDLNYDYSYKRFEFALGSTMMEGKLDAAFAMGFTSWSEERTTYDGYDPAGGDMTDADIYTYEPNEANGCTDFDFRLRYWHDLNESWTLVPHASYTNMKEAANYFALMEPVNTDFDGTYMYEEWEEKMNILTLGFGSNYYVTDDVMTVTDFGLEFWKETETWTDFDHPDLDPSREWMYDYEWKDTAVPYFKIGLDAKVLKWLDIRLGAETYWYSYKNTYQQPDDPATNPGVDDEDEFEYVYEGGGAWTDLYLGAGMYWGDLEIDVCVDTDFMQNGPYFISGEDTSYMFERVTIKYNF